MLEQRRGTRVGLPGDVGLKPNPQQGKARGAPQCGSEPKLAKRPAGACHGVGMPCRHTLEPDS